MRQISRTSSRRGVALMMVLVVIGLATVLGVAMLSGASLRNQISTNSDNSTAAESLAESGLNLALYYLQYPEYAPGGPFGVTGPYWTGTGGPVAFTSNISGTIDVTVARDVVDKWTYNIVSVGRPSQSSHLTRTARARVKVVAKYEVPHAAAFENDLAVTATTVMDGSVFCRRGVVLKTNTNITGVCYRGIVQFQLFTPGGGWQPLPYKPFVVPTNLSEIRSYRTYSYVNDGFIDTAGSIPAGATIVADLKPTATNRGGIYYSEGDVTIGANIRVEGTLIVRGNLITNTSRVEVVAKDGFPGLIVDGNIDMRQLTPELKVQGLCWVKGRVFTGATGLAKFNVEGGLIINGTSPLFNASTLAQPNIKFDASRTQIPDLCDVGRTVVGLNVQSWSVTQ